MPTRPTYPGVYVEEIPSGVRTITGVATSITAFLGRAARGEQDEPVTIHNFGDFERLFGGLDAAYPMSYAVRDFYLNGGSEGIIVRLFRRDAANGKAKWDNGTGFKLEAASPGEWGDNLKVKVDRDNITREIETSYGLSEGDLFNLTVREYFGIDPSERRVVAEERIRNVAVKPVAGSRRVDRVLAQESQLVRIPLKADGEPDLPSNPPAPTTAPAPTTDGGTDGDGGADGDGAAANGGGTAVLTQLARARAEEEEKFKDLSGGRDSAALQQQDYSGSLANKTGLFALEKADLFNLLCIPPDTRQGDTPSAVYKEAMEYCKDRRAMLIVDPPHDWDSASDITQNQNKGLTDLGLSGLNARNVALYFPRVLQADPQREGQIDTFAPSGIIAGVMASTDVQRGVWKAPAGIDAALNGVQGLQVNLTDDENGTLNPLGINCLRTFPVIGSVVWGARTLRGADQLADEYKYVPVRRLALYIEESLYRGLKWVVFEPNDEPLWSQIRLNVGAFMQNLFRQGAFQGQTPQKAYFVKCDSETTTQNDINLGIVNVMVGFAPLKPAEFVILKIQQMAGEIEV
jgi:uncharacterized protein